jgi:homoserine dehydrogenase
MDIIDKFIIENPKMRLDTIAQKYSISVSAISKRRQKLGIKHGTADVCIQIQNMLHLRNMNIAKELGCTEQLVAHVRFKNKKLNSVKRIELTPENIVFVKKNYTKMNIVKMAEIINISSHILRKRMTEMELYKYTDNCVKFYDHDLDDGNGFFDLEKYKKVML